MPEQECGKNPMLMEKRHAVMLEMSFSADWSLFDPYPVWRLKISKMSQKCGFGQKLQESMFNLQSLCP